ncbi:sensor histidine kinase [Brevibacillus fluminis]|uniref:sensor histidine kinase n=1 Tax=Brevibacillus fluminis TaxID=511487 RepID=UPI003F8A0514
MKLTRDEQKTTLYIVGSLLLFSMIRLWNGTEPFSEDHQKFLLIHTLLELFSIFVSYSIFLQSWYTFTQSKHRPLLFGILFFCVGSLDLAHTLLYKGMPFLADGHSVSRATWLWIMARVTESVGLGSILIRGELLRSKNTSKPLLFAVALLYLFVVISFITIYPSQLPVLLKEGIGVTSLKLGAEYVISFVHLLNMLVMLNIYRKQKDVNMLSLVTGTVFILLGELAFTLYKTVYDLENVLGHICKATGYFFLMKGIFFPQYQEVIEEKELAESKLQVAVGQLEENEKKMTTLVIEAQEEERKRVSRELHDGIGQSLYSIIFSLGMAQKRSDSLRVELEPIQSLADSALEEVRRMASRLRPSVLDDLGLIPALRAYAEQYQDTYGIETQLEVLGVTGRYPAEVETALYRICQEGLTNAAKYAQTPKAKVTIEQAERCVSMTIQDFGNGFLLEEVLRRPNKGIGLFSMRERAALLNGTLSIHSDVQGGTRIEVLIPLEG